MNALFGVPLTALSIPHTPKRAGHHWCEQCGGVFHKIPTVPQEPNETAPSTPPQTKPVNRPHGDVGRKNRRNVR